MTTLPMNLMLLKMFGRRSRLSRSMWLSQTERSKLYVRYEYSFGVAEDELLLTEVWQDAEAIEVHKNSLHFAKLGELKAEYVENTEFMKFSAEQV